MHACAKGEFDLVSLLLSNGASVGAVDRQGRSALFYVLESTGANKQGLFKLLGDEKCDVDLVDQEKVG
jgi:hypothetical protein